MPDALAHYAVSYLVASRVTKPRHALLLALIGILPDVDILLRIHRWITHSLVLTATLVAVAAIPVFYADRKHFKYLVLALALYVLHIALDVFTAPTPLLWPLVSQAYMVSMELNGVVASGGIKIAPSISVYSKAVDFTQQPLLEGPVVSPQGMVTAIGALAVLLTEWLAKTARSEYQ